MSASSLRKAQAIFEEEIGKSFGIELADLSRERWSLVPPVGDFLTEIRTKGRFGTLTYVRSGGEAEDISLFQRARTPQHRRLRVDAAPEDARLARVQRGRRSRLRRLALLDRRDHRSRSPADRGPHRDAPDGALHRGRHAHLQAGRIAERLRRRRRRHRAGCSRCASAARTACSSTCRGRSSAARRSRSRSPTAAAWPVRRRIARRSRCSRTSAIQEEFALAAEPRLLYSNRSYWYPQAPVTDYATGVLRLTVPDKRACVASGTPASGNPVRVTSTRGPGLRYVFLVEPAGALLLDGDLAARSGRRRRGEGAVPDHGGGAGQPAAEGRRAPQGRRRRRRSSASTATCSATSRIRT